MKNRTAYRLLFNQLWLINPKISEQLKLNAAIGKDWDSQTINTELPKQFGEVIALKPALTKEPAQIEEPKTAELTITNSSDGELLDMPKLSDTSIELILDWDMLVSQINSCAKCELCHTRQNVVIERGNREAKWMFVGEGPGEQEDIQGKPFVGASGQLLQKMIVAMKLDPDTDVYICNVVKCRPPYNRNPETSEIEACKNYLLSQIELVKPEIIVTLGRFACQTLLNTNLATGRLRSKVHYYQKIPLIVTYHPSYLLRNPSAKKDAWEDLQLAMKQMGIA